MYNFVGYQNKDFVKSVWTWDGITECQIYNCINETSNIKKTPHLKIWTNNLSRERKHCSESIL